MGLSIAIIVCALIAVSIFKAITRYTKLRHFPGPRWTAISDWPHSLAMLSGDCHKWYADVSEKYGPIARVAPRVLITSSPEVWMHVNTKPGYKRSDWYYNAARIEYQRDNVFSQTDNVKHEARRKQMAPGYSGRENLDLEKSVDERLTELLHLIRSKYLSSESYIVPMDLAKKVQYFTLDVISSVGLGKTFGMLQSDTDIDNYLQSSEEGLAIGNTALALGFSWLTQAPLIARFIAPSPRDNNGFGKMMASAFRVVDERAASFFSATCTNKEKSDMLASFMRHGLSGDELRSEALEQIIAGSDTTAAAMRGTLLHIITNPRVYRRLQREIDDAVVRGDAPTSILSTSTTGRDAGLITAAQAAKLPYLQAVIRESIRVLTPVSNIFARDVPKEGDTVIVDGERVFVPGGDSVCIGYSAYAMHRSEKIYGKDAQAFRPERWLETDSGSDPARMARMIRTNDLVFGHGHFRCLGRPVAQVELAKTVFELLRNFDIALIDPTHPWDVRNHLGLFAISNMWVQVMERA